MKEERLQEIIGQLEAEPEKPVLLARENEADEAYGLLWGTHPGIRLATIHGVSYLAITDAALQVLVERLERERQQFRVTVQHYDRQIAWVKGLMGGGRRKYCNSRGTLAPETEEESRQAGEELLARHKASGK